MAEVRKVLGQSAPGANADTTLYTVPASTEAIVSTIAVCNRASTPTTYRVAVRPNGTAIANQHYVAYDVPLEANEAQYLTLGLTLDAADVITVRAGSANVSFSAFGAEVS